MAENKNTNKNGTKSNETAIDCDIKSNEIKNTKLSTKLWKIRNVFTRNYKILKYSVVVVVIFVACFFIAKQYTKNVYPYFGLIKLNKQAKNNDSLYDNSFYTSTKETNNEKIEENNYKNEDNTDYIDDYENISHNNISNSLDDYLMKQEALNNKLIVLENNILELQNTIENLQKNILELENNNPINNEKNLQIVILLHKIENIVHIGGDFSDYFEYLKNLTKNKNLILENVLKLERYKKQKSQQELKNIFFKEYENILAKRNNNENKLRIFLSDNIKIRKVGNFKENTDSLDINLYNIENNIEKFSYTEAIDIILNYGYENDFSNTLNILYEKSNALLSIKEILNFIYNI